jgi:hypothetical protein
MKWFQRGAGQSMVAAVALLALSGCGGTGTVSGKVTLNGTALEGGLVSIVDSEQQTRTGKITPAGTYSISNVAPGQAKFSILTVSSMPSIRQPEGGAKDPYGKYTPIPAKYTNANDSGFALDVKSGKQDYDLKMTGDATPAPTAEQK